MYDDDNGPTLIYSDSPNLADRVTTQDGRGYFNASSVNDATNREIARISQTNLIPGQVVNTGIRPRVPPPQPYQPQPQPQYQQPAPPPQQYAPQYAQPQYQQYQQEVYYQPQQQQMPPQPPVDPDAGAEQESDGVVPLFPNYEMIRVNDTYHLYVDIPGVKKEDLKLSFTGGQLIVGGKRTLKSALYNTKGAKQKGNKGKKPTFEAMSGVRNYLLGEFSFPFYFPCPVDTSADSFNASIEDGILHVEMKIATVANGISLSIK